MAPGYLPLPSSYAATNLFSMKPGRVYVFLGHFHPLPSFPRSFHRNAIGYRPSPQLSSTPWPQLRRRRSCRVPFVPLNSPVRPLVLTSFRFPFRLKLLANFRTTVMSNYKLHKFRHALTHSVATNCFKLPESHTAIIPLSGFEAAYTRTMTSSQASARILAARDAGHAVSFLRAHSFAAPSPPPALNLAMSVAELTSVIPTVAAASPACATLLTHLQDRPVPTAFPVTHLRHTIHHRAIHPTPIPPLLPSVVRVMPTRPPSTPTRLTYRNGMPHQPSHCNPR